MSKTVKALLYNFLGFTPIFLLLMYVVEHYTGLRGLWVPFTAAVATTILAPKFQAVKRYNEEKIFMRWLFIKGTKEVK